MAPRAAASLAIPPGMVIDLHACIGEHGRQAIDQDGAAPTGYLRRKVVPTRSVAAANLITFDRAGPPFADRCRPVSDFSLGAPEGKAEAAWQTHRWGGRSPATFNLSKPPVSERRHETYSRNGQAWLAGIRPSMLCRRIRLGRVPPPVVTRADFETLSARS